MLECQPVFLTSVTGIVIIDRQKESDSEVECSIWFWMLSGDIHIDVERALAIISHLAGWETELQDEDDRQTAFGPHIPHPAVPESTRPSLKTTAQNGKSSK